MDQTSGLSRDTRAGIGTSSASILPGSFVPAKVPEAMPMTRAGMWLGLRCAETDEITAERDGRTADGEHNEARLRREWAPRMRALLAVPESFEGSFTFKDGTIRVGGDKQRAAWLLRLFVQDAIRARGLSKALAWSVFKEMADEVWLPLFPSGVRVPSRRLLVDEAGNEISENHAMLMRGHNASRGVAQPNIQEHVIPAILWPAPPEPVKEADFMRLADEAARGTNAWFSPDEHFEPAPQSFVEKFMSFFSADGSWKRVIASVTNGKEQVTSSELESALVSAGLAEAPFTTPDHQRLLRIMSAEGWAKKNLSEGGARKRAFVRGAR